MDGHIANDLAIINHLHYRISNLAVGGKHAVNNGAERSILQLPGDLLRKLCCTADRVNANGADSHFVAGGDVLILGGQNSMIESAVRNSGGNYDQGVGNRTLRAVTGVVHNLQLVRALRLGTVSGRSTAVQVDGLHTAQRQHNLSLLLYRQTDGLGLTAAICCHDNNIAIRSNADGLTGILIHIVQTRDNLAILNQMDVAANGLNNTIFMGSVFAFVSDQGRTIIQNGEEGICITRSIAVDLLAFHHKRAGGLSGSGVVVRTIDSNNNVVGGRMIFLSSRCLLSGQLHAPRRGIIVFVIGLNLHRVNAHIHRGYEHFHTVAVLVQSNHSVLLNTRSQSSLLVLNHSDPLWHDYCGKGRSRQNAHHHHHSQQHR